jgi:hypothetical protein
MGLDDLDVVVGRSSLGPHEFEKRRCKRRDQRITEGTALPLHVVCDLAHLCVVLEAIVGRVYTSCVTETELLDVLLYPVGIVFLHLLERGHRLFKRGRIDAHGFAGRGACISRLRLQRVPEPVETDLHLRLVISH